MLGCVGWTLQAVTAGDGPSVPIPDRFAALERKLAPLTFDAATHALRITEVNLRLLNGLGATDITNGLGNLIVGDHEPRDSGDNRQTGSHHVVVGKPHQCSSVGGVVGLPNEIRGVQSAVSRRVRNTAAREFSSVSGGDNRTAEGDFDWVAGSLVEDG